MYITPEEFNKKFVNEEINGFALLSTKNNHHLVEKVIEVIRPINKKDPGFCYSCMCKHDVTEWRFGYTDLAIFEEADKAADEFMKDHQKDDSNIGGIIGAFMNPNTDACVCPFSGGN